MKTIFIVTGLAFMVFILFGCNRSSQSQSASSEVPTPIDSTVSDGHNSSISLDVDGEYKGTLPCADCEGIETKIILNKDKSYVKQIKYLGKNGRIFEEKGSYIWNNEGNTITLSGIKNAPNQYFVGKNKLIQLDMNGNKITGDQAEKHVLLK